jgi:O-antigen ligase
MKMPASVRPDRRRIAAALLILFGFSAWNMTGMAHVALLGLLLLLLADLPRAWPRLRRDPAVWMAGAALLLTTLLAVRAVLLFPETAPLQWTAIWEWCAPFLFLVVAWWLRADLRLIHGVLIAAVAGLIVGVLRKSDWTLIEEMLGGMRYYFGHSVLGIGFVASVVLIGLLIYYPSWRRARPMRRQAGPLLIWMLWLFSVLFVIGMLVVLQARGAVLVLAVAGGMLVVYRLAQPREPRRAKQVRRLAAVSLLLLTVLAGAVLWVSRDRVAVDIDALTAADPTGEAGWSASAPARLNLWRTGLDLFEARPWLGWGPGTPSTEYLVPEQVITFPPATLEHGPIFSHLHSVIAEMLVRFGLAGVLVALIWLAILAMAGRVMWSQLAERDPRLRELLLLGTLMTAVFFLYDFRILNMDLRFFMILYLGIFYTFWLHRGTGGAQET